MSNKTKVLIVIALIVSVGSLGIAYAALSQTLTLSAQVAVAASKLDVRFEAQNNKITTSEFVTSNGASVQSDADVNETSITNIEIVFSSPGQSVSFPLKAVNHNENFGAKLSDVLFTGNGSYDDSNIKLICSSNDSDICTKDAEYDEEDKNSVYTRIRTDFIQNLTVSIYKTVTGSQDVLLAQYSNGTWDKTSLTSNAGVLNKYAENDNYETYKVVVDYSINAIPDFPEGYLLVASNINLNFKYLQQAS